MPLPGPSFELSSIDLACPTTPATLYFTKKTLRPYPSPISRYGPPNRGVGHVSENKIFFFAFLAVLNVFETFNFRRYLEVFLGKIFFLVRYPKFEWLQPVHLSSYRRYFSTVRLSLLPSIFGCRNGPPTPPLSRDIAPQTGCIGHFSENFRRHQV
mgnify:CR=1 FL=1